MRQRLKLSVATSELLNFRGFRSVVQQGAQQRPATPRRHVDDHHRRVEGVAKIYAASLNNQARIRDLARPRRATRGSSGAEARKENKNCKPKLVKQNLLHRPSIAQHRRRPLIH